MTAEPLVRPEKPIPPEFFTEPPADPHAANAELRAACPVHAIDYPPGSEAYMVMDYATSFDALSDPRLSKDPRNAPAWFREALEHAARCSSTTALRRPAPTHPAAQAGRARVPAPADREEPAAGAGDHR